MRLCLDRGLLIEGLEASASMAESLCKRLSCSVRQGFLEETDLDAQAFSALVGYDVLEHSLSPFTWLRKAHSLLRQDGLLILSTVSILNLLDTVGRISYRIGLNKAIEKLYPPYHLYYFTPHLLASYLRQTGFAVIEMEQENYDYRKASSRLTEQFLLRIIYKWHDISGNKTNLYVTARKTG